jgi:SAM-dependent methyltransferase
MAAAADHDGLRESYDELPYRDRAFEFMHPNALARTAILAGLDAPPIEGCRVLELGCAAGANLMAMAEGLPGATFVGIDLSPRQIEAGRRTAESLGLTNVRLEAMSIVDLTPDFGQFDYILCHGVYSWVPPEVQARILEVCRDNLATQGLACVSYNTYPGWHARGSVREMMLYHVDPDATPALRVRQARQMIEALAAIAAQTHQSERSPLKAIREELELVRDAEDDYIFHELL